MPASRNENSPICAVPSATSQVACGFCRISSIGSHFGSRFIESAGAILREQLTGYGPRLDEKLADLESERTYLMSVASPLRDLSSLTGGTKDKLAALGAQFVRTSKLAPQPKDVILKPKAPRTARPQEPGKPSADQHAHNAPKSRSN